jgi:hypothetical protein
MSRLPKLSFDAWELHLIIPTFGMSERTGNQEYSWPFRVNVYCENRYIKDIKQTIIAFNYKSDGARLFRFGEMPQFKALRFAKLHDPGWPAARH